MGVFLKGLKLGMLLQLAVGPVCMFVFSSSSESGFVYAEYAVLAVTLVDGLYILLAVLGASSLLKSDKTRSIFKITGSMVIGLFGLNMVASVFSAGFIPVIDTTKQMAHTGSFLKGILLTASNPLTILFWAGVFSAQVAERNYRNGRLYLFAAGCVCSTLFFLTVIAACGALVNYMLAGTYEEFLVGKLLNAAVGVVLLFFAIKLALKKV